VKSESPPQSGGISQETTQCQANLLSRNNLNPARLFSVVFLGLSGSVFTIIGLLVNHTSQSSPLVENKSFPIVENILLPTGIAQLAGLVLLFYNLRLGARLGKIATLCMAFIFAARAVTAYYSFWPDAMFAVFMGLMAKAIHHSFNLGETPPSV
jgi:hypothetical protein